jgi:hypothetical protein
MNTPEMARRIVEVRPRLKANIAVVFYLLTILTGLLVFVVGGRLGFVVDVVATVFYTAVTALFYVLTKGA